MSTVNLIWQWLQRWSSNYCSASFRCSAQNFTETIHIFHNTSFCYVYAIGFFNVYVSNKVYWFQKHSNVQGLVEVAYVYILARSGSSTKDQLLYVPTRLEDIEDLAWKLDVDGKKYRDILRFFSGDTPARQLEAGNQCGGRFNLWSKPLLCIEAI